MTAYPMGQLAPSHLWTGKACQLFKNLRPLALLMAPSMLRHLPCTIGRWWVLCWKCLLCRKHLWWSWLMHGEPMEVHHCSLSLHINKITIHCTLFSICLIFYYVAMHFVGLYIESFYATFLYKDMWVHQAQAQKFCHWIGVFQKFNCLKFDKYYHWFMVDDLLCVANPPKIINLVYHLAYCISFLSLYKSNIHFWRNSWFSWYVCHAVHH